MTYLPDLLTFNDGSKVQSEKCWEKRRKELLEALYVGEYGRTPEAPEKVEGKLAKEYKNALAGLADFREYALSFQAELGHFTFPAVIFVRHTADQEKSPLIVYLNHSIEPFSLSYMAEEFATLGFSLAVVSCMDFGTDDDDFTTGLAPLYSRRNDGTDWGKLGMWAFGVSRAVDFLRTLPEVDENNIAVAGMSRLGKASLWAGAQDEHIRFTISNDSGCAGMAYERGNQGNYEDVKRISTNFPYWFCENYGSYAGRPFEMPFDQHFAAALCAPRHLLAGGDTEDPWADPVTMEETLRAVSPVYELLGKPGYIAPETPIEEGKVNGAGSVSYHLRAGGHAFTRTDWLRYIEYMKKHL